MQKYKLSRSNHNKLFPLRRLNLFYSYNYSINEHGLMLLKRPSWFGKLCLVLLSPVIILAEGFIFWWLSVKEVFNPDVGFDADFVSAETDIFNEFLLLAKEIKN